MNDVCILLCIFCVWLRWIFFHVFVYSVFSRWGCRENRSKTTFYFPPQEKHFDKVHDARLNKTSCLAAICYWRFHLWVFVFIGILVRAFDLHKNKIYFILENFEKSRENWRKTLIFFLYRSVFLIKEVNLYLENEFYYFLTSLKDKSNRRNFL